MTAQTGLYAFSERVRECCVKFDSVLSSGPALRVAALNYFGFSGLFYIRHAVLRQVTILQQPFPILPICTASSSGLMLSSLGRSPARRHAISPLCSGAPSYWSSGFSTDAFQDVEVCQLVYFALSIISVTDCEIFSGCPATSRQMECAFLKVCSNTCCSAARTADWFSPADAAHYVANEVDPAELLTGGERLLYRRLRAAVRVGDNRLHAFQTVFLRLRRKVSQYALASDSSMPIPIISRRPSQLTAQTIITAKLTTPPLLRTFTWVASSHR